MSSHLVTCSTQTIAKSVLGRVSTCIRAGKCLLYCEVVASYYGCQPNHSYFTVDSGYQVHALISLSGKEICA